jgi:hypothetical protein
VNLTEREWSKTERGQFTFYASFAVALKRLRDPAERCAAYDAIIDYALRGAAPDLDALPDAVAIAFELIRPNLDSSRRKAEAGRKGGEIGAEADEKRPKSDKEAKRKQRRSKREIERETENETEIETEYESEIEDKGLLSPASRREGESLADYSLRLKELKKAGYFDQNKAVLRPKGSVKLDEKEGTSHANDTG